MDRELAYIWSGSGDWRVGIYIDMSMHGLPVSQKAGHQQGYGVRTKHFSLLNKYLVITNLETSSLSYRIHSDFPVFGVGWKRSSQGRFCSGLWHDQVVCTPKL